jgi:hypothetical protein
MREGGKPVVVFLDVLIVRVARLATYTHVFCCVRILSRSLYNSPSLFTLFACLFIPFIT